MASNYNGLTRNTWPGTWSPTANHPIVLDTEIRGGLRTVSGVSGDRLTDITGQRLEVGMMVYLQQSYSQDGHEYVGDRYYRYSALDGESRDINTGELPNTHGNWQLLGGDLIDLSNINENLTPSSTLTFDLGNNERKWKGVYAETLYLGTSTIFLGNDKISLDNQGNLLINDQLAVEKFKFYITGDDSSARIINANETIKFIGNNGVTTTTDDEGNLTISGTIYDLSPYATTSYVNQEISNILSTAPETLDTLKELADALGNDANFSTSILNELSKKLDKVDQYKFKIASDDSTSIEINDRETIKFVGGVGVSTSIDSEGNITFDGFSGSWNDLTQVPNFSSVSLTGSYLDLNDTPIIPPEYSWNIAGDDSVQRPVSNGETVKIIGVNGVFTNTDSEGNVIITGTTYDLTPYATISYVDTQIADLIDGAPTLLNTLNELAQALSSDENFGANVINILDNKLDKSQQYRFYVSADDSAEIEIQKDESVRFIGGVGVSTSVDDEGNVTINGFSGHYQDLLNIPEEFSFNIQSNDSSVFTVRNGSNLRLTGNLGISIEGDSSEGFVISGPDLSAIDQSLVPKTTEIYDLGSSDKRWKDLYLSGNSIEIGPATIQVNQDGGNEQQLSILGVNSLSINGAVIKAVDQHVELPLGSTLNGVPLITAIENTNFQFTVSADDSTPTNVDKNNSNLTILGRGNVTTSVDEQGNVLITGSTASQTLNDLDDVEIDPNNLSIGKVLKYNGNAWVAANETGNNNAGSGSGDAATLNGFDGTHYLNYNNLTNKPDPYSLPPATTSSLGGVIVGENINVNNGVISVPKGAGINKVVDIPDVYDDNGLPDGAILSYNIGAERWETQAIDLSNSVMDGGFY